MKKIILTIIFTFAVLLSYGQTKEIAAKSKALQGQCISTFKYFKTHPSAVKVHTYIVNKKPVKVAEYRLNACDSSMLLIAKNEWFNTLGDTDRHFRMNRIKFYEKLAVKNVANRNFLLTWTLRACTPRPVKKLK